MADSFGRYLGKGRGQSDDRRLLKGRNFAKRHHRGIPINLRHLKVEDEEMWLESFCFFNYFRSIGGLQHLVAPPVQNGTQ